MARRGSGASIATGVGVAAGVGAAQLGFAYGLGIVDWAPADPATGTAAWVASLVWATWIAATSTVLGAVCAQRLGDRAPAADDPRGTGGGSFRHAALALAAGVGALVTVLLVAVPARVAEVPDTASPRTVAAAYAAIGVLVGVLTALWALHSRAAAANVVATVGWLWLLAAVAVLDGVLAGRGLAPAQLGIWQLSADDGRFWIRDWFYWPGALLSLGSALVIGALAARRSARNPDTRVGAATSGAAGPLLVATAYALGVPGLTAIAPEQGSAHLTAPYAVIVGVGGSALVAALAQRAARRAAARASVTVPRQRTGEPAAFPLDVTAGHPADGDQADAGRDESAGTRRDDRSDPGPAGAGTSDASTTATSVLTPAPPAAPARRRATRSGTATAAPAAPSTATPASTAAAAVPPTTTSARAPGGTEAPASAATPVDPGPQGRPAPATDTDPAAEDPAPGGRRARPGRRPR